MSPNREDAAAAAHELLGIDGCATCAPDLQAIEEEVRRGLGERHGHDGSNSLARILWVLVRHTHPRHVVEIGVARGVSSAFVLDALDRNGDGQLWSIDVPPVRPKWRVPVGSAIPDRLKERWTYIRGASRRHLPPLLSEIEAVDLFVHDGLHTPETMTFEFHHVWPYLSKDGVLVADDADANKAFTDFARRVGREPLLVGEADKQAIVGLVRA